MKRIKNTHEKSIECLEYMRRNRATARDYLESIGGGHWADVESYELYIEVGLGEKIKNHSTVPKMSEGLCPLCAGPVKGRCEYCGTKPCRARRYKIEMAKARDKDKPQQ